jgi:hypothetical protein
LPVLYRASSDLMVAASPGFMARGAVNVIGLERLKAAAGERWMRIRDGVHARLESLLRGMLGPADFFAQINETAYLITMPSSTPEDVNLICLRAAFELHNSFLGECHIDQIVVGAALPGARNGELAVVPLPVEKLSILAKKAGVDPLPPVGAAAPAGPPSPTAAPAHSALPNTNATTQPQVSSRMTSLDVKLSVTYHFQPIWSVPNNAITNYLCDAKTIIAPHRRDSIPIHALEPWERSEVEMACFRHGVETLQENAAESRQFILTVGLSYEFLLTPAGRQGVLATLRGLPSLMRNYLSFVIHTVPHGVAQSQLGTLVNILRPFGRGVSASLPPNSRLYRAYQDIGLKSIGFALREFGSRLPDKLTIEEMALFARRNKLGTFVTDVNNVNMLKFVQDAGIQQVGGLAVAPYCEIPQGVYRMTWHKLMAEPVVEIWN